MQRIEPRAAPADERTVLLEFLAYQRAVLMFKTEGLDAERLRRATPPTALSLAALLKHLAYVEDHWMQVTFLGRAEAELDPWGGAPFDDDPDWDLHSAADDDPDYLRELYTAAGGRTDAVVGSTPDLGRLSATARRDGFRPNLRWILVHLVEETARHLGHADILRESIDGAVGDG